MLIALTAKEKLDKITEIIKGADSKSADGKSAYELWIDEGSSGTKQDFLNSLKGERGEPGPQGVQGPPGTGILNTRNNTQCNIWVGTQSQYDSDRPNESNTIVFIVEG